jgi:hypothetical protein
MNSENPYAKLPDFNFWHRSVASPYISHVDPVIKSKIIINSDKVATIGSCFAQHLSRKISDSGLNYFVAEAPIQNLDPFEAIKKNYGVFSARYGNVYTPRQALQLFDRAFGHFDADSNIWLRGNRYIDAYRPRIEPDGFFSEQDLLEDRLNHLKCVRRVFNESNWLIFTLGLTEAWQSTNDRSLFPLPPGICGEKFDEDKYEFVNFNSTEIFLDLKCLIEKIIAINPTINILLTISPVPLIATYENRHVLVSTCVSKSILRVAVDEVEKIFSNVFYFPSYEIINSPSNAGKFFSDDLRSINNLGINHIMKIFSKHFIEIESKKHFNITDINTSHFQSLTSEVICDEEEIKSTIKDAGL